ncbi:MAG: SAM hydrolase/SAM-dependent halogenase family protein [Longimicrobiales bacterium]
MARITLLTDFGTADAYTAAIKGVIASIAPDASIDDAGHELEPGAIMAAAWALRRFWRLYPAGTVHLVVVDPGVGSERRALAARADDRLFVAPDNGVLSHVAADAAAFDCVAIENQAYLRAHRSATFHGRDVFAPAAAHLACGVELDRLGPPVDNPLLLLWPEPARAAQGADGEVVHVDRFGNLTSNIPADWVTDQDLVWIGDRVIGPLRRAYSDVEPGELVALIGSEDFVEVAARDGNAAAELEAGRGTAVRTRRGSLSL